MVARGSPVILRRMRNSSGALPRTGLVFRATGLYFFFDAAKTCAGESPLLRRALSAGIELLEWEWENVEVVEDRGEIKESEVVVSARLVGISLV